MQGQGAKKSGRSVSEQQASPPNPKAAAQGAVRVLPTPVAKAWSRNGQKRREHDISPIAGMVIVCLGKPGSGMARASLEGLLRHCGAMVEDRISESTDIVALGSIADVRSRVKGEGTTLVSLLSAHDSHVRVVDADELLQQVLR